MANISHFTQTVNGVSTTYDIHDADAIPLAGTNKLSGSIVPDTDNAYDFGSSGYRFINIFGYNLYTTFIYNYNNTSQVAIYGGTSYQNGAEITAYGKDHPYNSGCVYLVARDGTNTKAFIAKPDGTLTWNGQSIQTTSDQRLKQQIAEIDDKLLDAWEDVDLVQFKYNDAVDQKKDKARLHTGYVVQQIDNACKEHGVDVSQYGLYCHEEYPQETEEVEVEQADGTKTKEKKVIREASEHYSLRYTEVYAVECMYLRRCIARLTARIEELEKGNNSK